MPANTAPPSGGGAPNAATPRRHGAGAWTIVLGLLALNLVFAFAFDPAPKHRSVPYSAFRAQVGTGNIEEVSSKGSTIQGRFRHEIRYPKGAGGHDITAFETERPAFAHDDLLAALLARGTIVNAKPVQSGRSTLLTLLLGFAPTLLIVGFFLWMMRRATGSMGAGGGMLGGMGRSRARRYADRGSRTTFADVAGIDEATDELSEVVDFLRHPERYRRLGGVTPKGVLLTGPPGTGKTLLARAVAGEADVPFFSVSASEFVEMIVGVGASRVRDLFDQAKKDAPSIVFIDELDAIGRARGGSAMSGASDEREQTLNQILTEMDGFTGSEGVIVLAATNRPEILDPALLRAGRFDRRIAINPPDRAGRLQILRVHTRSVPLAGDDILDTVASTTPGMVGADLRTLVNEAALGAARREHVTVQLDDFSTALERILLGAARRIVLSEDDRRRTAYHEAGHALLGMLQVGADPVRKVSIIPRGNTLGVTFQSRRPTATATGSSSSTAGSSG